MAREPDCASSNPGSRCLRSKTGRSTSRITRTVGPTKPTSSVNTLKRSSPRREATALVREDETSVVLAALSDPVRRRLLDILATREEATATSVAEGLPITRQAVVKHFAVLSNAGL